MAEKIPEELTAADAFLAIRIGIVEKKLTFSPTIRYGDSNNHFWDFLFLRLSLLEGVSSLKLLSMSPEEFNVPVCPTVRSANSSMFRAAFQSLSCTWPPWGHLWVLSLSDFLTISPQLEQFWRCVVRWKSYCCYTKYLAEYSTHCRKADRAASEIYLPNFLFLIMFRTCISS